LGSP
jgi:hypothetical protein